MERLVARERKAIDAALREYLDALAAAAPAAAPENNGERVRANRAGMMKALQNRGAIPGLPNRVQAHDVTIAGQLTGRLYTPPQPGGPLPVLVYLHGGGWVVGSAETHDPFCRLLCEASGVMIFSVNYRLAPESPFPAALEDTLTAYRWVLEHAADFGGDGRRVLLGGDSAGANLAAVAANRICSADEEAKPEALLLLYPVMDHPSAGHASYAEKATGYGLTAEQMTWLWEQYAAGVAPGNPEIAPLRLQRLPALPPTLVATAEYDPLCDEGIAYAEKLQAAGVAVTHLHASDMHHNFAVHPGTIARFPQAITALDAFAAWLRETLGGR